MTAALRLPPGSFGFADRAQVAFHEKPIHMDMNSNQEHLVLGQPILPISNQRGGKISGGFKGKNHRFQP
jgi:hypothetical protein